MWTPARLKHTLAHHLRGGHVVVLANRAPYIHERKADGSIAVVHPASGLVTALEPVMRACSGVWVAHGSGSADRDTADARGRVEVPSGEAGLVAEFNVYRWAGRMLVDASRIRRRERHRTPQRSCRDRDRMNVRRNGLTVGGRMWWKVNGGRVRTLRREKVRRLPVISGGRLVGVIAQADVALRDRLSGDAGEMLARISERSSHYLSAGGTKRG